MNEKNVFVPSVNGQNLSADYDSMLALLKEVVSIKKS